MWRRRGALACMVLGAGACSLFVKAGELSSGDGEDAGLDVKVEKDVGQTEEEDVDSAPVIDASIPYRQAVIEDRPLAYYRFAETSAVQAAADQTAAHPATYVGPMQFNITPGALLNDTNPAVRMGSPDASCIAVGGSIDFPDTSPFSVEIWVKLDSFDDRFRELITKNTFDAGAGRQNFGIYVHQQELVFERYVANTSMGAGPGRLEANQYYHVVGTYDGKVLALYLNGALVGTTSDTRAAVPSQAELDIGCSVFPSGTYSVLGILDEAAIYNKALSATRVLTHYRTSGR